MVRTSFKFQLNAKSGNARAGEFSTPHGSFQTPVFAPVGTQATVKGVTSAQLTELGASLVLANTYHLYLRPGDDLVAELDGLHSFMNWDGPLLTDSGGFQVFSLAGIRTIDQDGVTFKSHLDGSLHRFTPEKSIGIQENLGADIIMAFDECPEPLDFKTNETAVEKSAEFISTLDLPGFAIGGLAVGESKDQMHMTLDVCNQLLPQAKPRYLMGVGTPEDLVNCVQRGIDIFDCVAPTRLARHKAAFLRRGRLNLARADLARDPRPIDQMCTCYTCQNYSRAYLRHLIMAKEMTGATLVSIHNLHTLIQLAQEMREAILEDCFADFYEDYFAPIDLKEEE